MKQIMLQCFFGIKIAIEALSLKLNFVFISPQFIVFRPQKFLVFADKKTTQFSLRGENHEWEQDVKPPFGHVLKNRHSEACDQALWYTKNMIPKQQHSSLATPATHIATLNVDLGTSRQLSVCWHIEIWILNNIASAKNRCSCAGQRIFFCFALVFEVRVHLATPTVRLSFPVSVKPSSSFTRQCSIAWGPKKCVMQYGEFSI